MAGFIEAFYFGNIEPQTRSIEINETYQEALTLLTRNEELLIRMLPDEGKRLFFDYVKACGIVDSESSLDSFTTGFRLGAMFMQDTFCGNGALLQSYLK